MLAAAELPLTVIALGRWRHLHLGLVGLDVDAVGAIVEHVLRLGLVGG